jgi:hypothetical protein
MHVDGQIEWVGHAGLGRQGLQFALVQPRADLRVGKLERLEQQKAHAHVANVNAGLDRRQLYPDARLGLLVDTAFDGRKLVCLKRRIVLHRLHVDMGKARIEQPLLIEKILPVGARSRCRDQCKRKVRAPGCVLATRAAGAHSSKIVDPFHSQPLLAHRINAIL